MPKLTLELSDINWEQYDDLLATVGNFAKKKELKMDDGSDAFICSGCGGMQHVKHKVPDICTSCQHADTITLVHEYRESHSFGSEVWYALDDLINWLQEKQASHLKN